jgi:hypothetical protein
MSEQRDTQNSLKRHYGTRNGMESTASRLGMLQCWPTARGVNGLDQTMIQDISLSSLKLASGEWLQFVEASYNCIDRAETFST